jgi:hypothetical protein
MVPRWSAIDEGFRADHLSGYEDCAPQTWDRSGPMGLLAAPVEPAKDLQATLESRPLPSFTTRTDCPWTWFRSISVKL